MNEQNLNNQNLDINCKKHLSKRQKKKILFLIFMMCFTVALLIGGTYAWFIGLGSVKVNPFDLNVTAGNQLELSLTGNTNDWHDDITISEETVITAGYTGNTNHGVGAEGLKPISTVGYIDPTTNRLDLFSKTSLTSTSGGFRIIADKVDNSIASGEQDGYFVFDLFVKNGEDVDYIDTFNYSDDEDIYMIKGDNNSAVGAPSGGGDDFGIANSIRVALMQIGRIKSQGYTPSTAQQITCADNSTLGILGLCNKGENASDNGLGKTWNIWEPNDNKHHEQSIERFNFICKTRELSGGVLNYTSNSCTALTATSIVPTYPVNRRITASMDAVDVYDGLNGYTSFDETHGINYVNTLGDTEVNVVDNSMRQAVFRLAPNSITKIRVYIYLEGQDVDNYDMIYKGEKIKIKFGFTRDRYEMENLTQSS